MGRFSYFRSQSEENMKMGLIIIAIATEIEKFFKKFCGENLQKSSKYYILPKTYFEKILKTYGRIFFWNALWRHWAFSTLNVTHD